MGRFRNLGMLHRYRRCFLWQVFAHDDSRLSHAEPLCRGYSADPAYSRTIIWLCAVYEPNCESDVRGLADAMRRGELFALYTAHSRHLCFPVGIRGDHKLPRRRCGLREIVADHRGGGRLVADQLRNNRTPGPTLAGQYVIEAQEIDRCATAVGPSSPGARPGHEFWRYCRVRAERSETIRQFTYCLMVARTTPNSASAVLARAISGSHPTW